MQQCDDVRAVISTRNDNLKTIQQLRIDMNSDVNMNRYHVYVEFIDSTGLSHIMFAYNCVVLRN